MSHPAGSHDSGSRNSPADKEKEILAIRSANIETAPDPDAGLSEDERARIVCTSYQARS